MATIPEPNLIALQELPPILSTGNGSRSAHPTPAAADALSEAIRACQVTEVERTGRPRITRVQTRINLRKPHPDLYVRVHATWRRSVFMYFSKSEREGYLVAAAMQDCRDLKVQPVEVRPYLTHEEEPVFAFWPTRLPRLDGTDNGWWESERDAADRAVHAWIRTIPREENDAYDVREAEFTDDPQWPAEEFDTLFARAVGRRVILDASHAIIRRLQGKA